MHLPFPQEGRPWNSQDYRSITVSSIAAKIYNSLLSNRIELKAEKILWKNQNGFRGNRSTTSQKTKNGNYTRMLRAILNKSWGQHPTKHQLYSHLPLITKTIQIRRTRHARHCCRSKDELISDILWGTPSHTHTHTHTHTPIYIYIYRTYMQQLCADTGCSWEDDRDGWRERVREIRAGSATPWWWW